MRLEFDVTTDIRRSAPDVFAFVTDPAQLGRWDPRVVEARVVGGGPLREGSRVREVRRLGRRRIEQVVRVSALEPPRRFDLRIEQGPVPVHADLRFEPEGEATVVWLHAHGTAPGPQLLAPVMRAIARRQMRSQYRRLKRVLEQAA